jgi:hypothetical protein
MLTSPLTLTNTAGFMMLFPMRLIFTRESPKALKPLELSISIIDLLTSYILTIIIIIVTKTKQKKIKNKKKIFMPGRNKIRHTN